MPVTVCPVCDDQYDPKQEDGCGRESCQARRAFIRATAMSLYAALLPYRTDDTQVMGSGDAKDCWNMAEKLWGTKPEGM